MKWRKTLNGWTMETLEIESLGSVINASTEYANNKYTLKVKYGHGGDSGVVVTEHTSHLRCKQAAKRQIDKRLMSAAKEAIALTEIEYEL